MLIVIFGIVGGIVGAASIGDEGILLGIVIGGLIASHINSRKQITELKAQLNRLSSHLSTSSVAVQQTTDAATEPASPAFHDEAVSPELPGQDSQPHQAWEESDTAIGTDQQMAESESEDLLTEFRQYDSGSPELELVPLNEDEPAVPAIPDEPDQNVALAPSAAYSDAADGPVGQLQRWLASVNPFVMIGVLVTFIGLAMLAKYAADKDMFPIEIRLAGVGLAGLIMILVGYRLRHRQLNYGLVLQGGGFGVIYLTIYATAKYYTLIPLSMALVLMLLVVLIAAIMAIIQNAMFLAVFASIGGFLTPVLTSDGSGRIELLLSYYLLLNIGILTLALFKSWRLLNWVGFVMTFGICLLWGIDNYTVDKYLLCQLFLAAFFSIYLFISIRFALLQPPRLRGILDGSITFGLPAIVFLIQNHIAGHYNYGPALGALILGTVYLVLRQLLYRRDADHLRTLCDAFTGIGLVLVSLAVPLSFSDQWTSVIWAVEACGLLWLGIRQDRLLLRCFALLLMVVAQLVNLPSLDSWSSITSDQGWGSVIINPNVIAAMILALACFAAARLYERSSVNRSLEPVVITPLLFISWFWIWIAIVLESQVWLTSAVWVKVIVGGTALLALVWLLVSQYLKWQRMRFILLAYWPSLLLATLTEISATGDLFYFSNAGLLAWLFAWLVHFLVLRTAASAWPSAMRSIWHLLGYWQILFVLMCGSLRFLSETTLDPDTLMVLTAALLPCTGLMWCMLPASSTRWPVRKFDSTYQLYAQLPVLAALFILTCSLIAFDGRGDLMPYLPVVHPVDLAQIIVCICGFYWARRINSIYGGAVAIFSARAAALLFSLAAFITINAIIARVMHHYFDVRWSDSAMMNSTLVQTTASIVWSSVALALMWIGHNRARRLLWIAGAILLGITLLKMFLIDLANTGNIARIVSFVGVGVLILIIGYVSPMPPSRESADESQSDPQATQDLP